MQVKNIFAFLILSVSLFLIIPKVYAVQDAVQDSLQQALDSLRIQAERDSIDLLFTTKYSGIVYDNPNRPGYIDSTLEKVFNSPPNKYLVDDEMLAGFFHPSYYREGIDKNSRPTWVLYTVLILFLLVGVIRAIFPTEFKIIIEAYYRERLLQQVSKEDSIATSWPYVFLYGVFSLALGLFIIVLVSEFKDPLFLTPLNFLQASGIIAILFLLKILIIRFISFVFAIERIVREYVAVVYLVYFNSMLFLLPFLLFVTFLPTVYFNILLILFIVVVSILFFYRVLRTAFHLFDNTKFSISYLILYLCALEIAPILILIRTLGN